MWGFGTVMVLLCNDGSFFICNLVTKNNYQVLQSDLFRCFKWPFQGLCELHLDDQKVTWKMLVQASNHHHHLHLPWCTPSVFSWNSALYSTFPAMPDGLRPTKCCSWLLGQAWWPTGHFKTLHTLGLSNILNLISGAGFFPRMEGHLWQHQKENA